MPKYKRKVYFPMNKTEFIAKVATDAMKEHEPISIVGFGTLSVAHREERTGQNPKTGEKVKIPARSAPVFKAGSTLKEAANSK